MLDPNKEYRTKNNEPIRIYATDGGSNKDEIHGAVKYKAGWEPTRWCSEEHFYALGNKEYNPLAKLKAGDPIIVWDTFSPNDKYLRIFAGITYIGKPLVNRDGLLGKDFTPVSYDHFELLPNYNYGD